MKSKPKNTWTATAGILGIAVSTLHSYRRRKGAPKTADPNAWRSYIEKNDLGFARNKVSPERERLLTRKAELEVRELERRAELESRQVLGMAEMKTIMRELIRAAKYEYRAIETWYGSFLTRDQRIEARVRWDAADRRIAEKIIRVK